MNLKRTKITFTTMFESETIFFGYNKSTQRAFLIKTNKEGKKDWKEK